MKSFYLRIRIRPVIKSTGKSTRQSVCVLIVLNPSRDLITAYAARMTVLIIRATFFVRKAKKLSVLYHHEEPINVQDSLRVATFKLVIAQTPVKRRGRDTEKFRSFSAMPAGLLKRGENLLAFNFA